MGGSSTEHSTNGADPEIPRSRSQFPTRSGFFYPPHGLDSSPKSPLSENLHSLSFRTGEFQRELLQ